MNGAIGAHALFVSDCPSCGVVFGITASMESERRSDGRNFYCPNGHTLAFGNSELDRLKREVALKEVEIANARRQREWAEKRAKGANIAAGIAKAKAERLLTRVHAGVCPHCRRTFKQLAEHMKAKHP